MNLGKISVHIYWWTKLHNNVLCPVVLLYYCYTCEALLNCTCKFITSSRYYLKQKLYQAVTTDHVKSFVQILSLCPKMTLSWSVSWTIILWLPSFVLNMPYILHENIIQQKMCKRISACKTMQKHGSLYLQKCFYFYFFEISNINYALQQHDL